MIGDEILQAEALASLLPMLPAEQHAGLVTTILALGRRVAKRDMEEGGLWFGILMQLAKLLPHLPESLQHEVIEESLIAARAYSDKTVSVWFLAELLPSIPQQFYQPVAAAARTMAESMYSDDEKERAFNMLAPFLNPPEQLEQPRQTGEGVESTTSAPGTSMPDAQATMDGETVRIALKAACSVNSGRGYRAEALRKVVPALLNLPPAERYELWVESLRDLSTQRLRSDLLSDIQVLGPVIESLGGTVAIRDCCRAIVDAGRWFP